MTASTLRAASPRHLSLPHDQSQTVWEAGPARRSQGCGDRERPALGPDEKGCACSPKLASHRLSHSARGRNRDRFVPLHRRDVPPASCGPWVRCTAALRVHSQPSDTDSDPDADCFRQILDRLPRQVGCLGVRQCRNRGRAESPYLSNFCRGGCSSFLFHSLSARRDWPPTRFLLPHRGCVKATPRLCEARRWRNRDRKESPPILLPDLCMGTY